MFATADVVRVEASTANRNSVSYCGCYQSGHQQQIAIMLATADVVRVDINSESQ